MSTEKRPKTKQPYLSLSCGSDPRGIAALSRESAIRRAGSSFWLLVRIDDDGGDDNSGRGVR